MKSIFNGLRLPSMEYRSLFAMQAKHAASPRFLTLSLVQYDGSLATPCVEEKAPVCVGTKIADGVVPVHSSASGHVVEVSSAFIRIESDEADRLDPSIFTRDKFQLDRDQLLGLIYEAGIVGLDGVPTHLKMAEARFYGVDTLVLNGCEAEPFLVADYLLMINHPNEILKGMEILRIASGAERIVIAVNQKRMEALEILNSRNYNLRIGAVETRILPDIYPQADERILIGSLAGRRLDKQEKTYSVGMVAETAATAYAVYEAVYCGRPLVERLVTLEGACVTEPKNVWAPVGISIRDLLRNAKGLLRDPGRLILGGPMKGDAIASLDEPLSKKACAVLALPQEWIERGEEEPCTRCGLCVASCPESLFPESILRAVRQTKIELMKELDIDGCSECGNCSYICPAHIPLVEVIRRGKSLAKETLSSRTSREPSHVLSFQAEA